MLDPTDFRALNALEQLFIREARWEECIDVLESRAAAQDEPSARIDTLLQAAAIWEEKVDDKERAAELYERVRAIDSSNRLASERLEEIYRAQYRWEQLNEILLERVEYTDQQSERIRLLQTVARIYEEELGAQESAFDVLEVAFRYDYSDEDTARELERLATAAGKWEALLAVYTQIVQSLERDDREQACDLWVKIGRWYGDHLAHIDYAIHSVQQALRLNPSHLGALSALAGFQHKRGSWHELIETLGRHAAIEPDRQKKVELYLRLAERLETQMQDAMQAIAAYQSALQADPSSMEALTALDRLYRRHEMWEQLIDVLGRTAELKPDPDDVVQLRLEIGELWDERLLDSGMAIGAYQEVLNVDPHNMGALRALEQLYEKTGESERYLDILEAQLDASPSDAGADRAVRAHVVGLGGALRQARPGGRLPGEDRHHRRGQPAGLPRAGAPVPPAGQVGLAGRHLPPPHPGGGRRGQPHRALLRDGAGLRGGAARLRPRHRGLRRRPDLRLRRAARARLAGPAVRADPGVGPGHRRDDPAGPHHARINAYRSTCTTAAAASTTPTWARRRRRSSTSARRSPSTRPTCRRWRS